MELTWRAATASEALRRSFIQPDFDDADWTAMPTPGHWQSTATFATSDGPLLYRSAIDRDRYTGNETRPDIQWPEESTRHWLVTHGIHNAADIWFNTSYLGGIDGYFIPHQFDVTELRDRTPAGKDDVVGVEVIASPARPPGKRATSLVGIWDDPETVGHTWNAGGIVRPVELVSSGPIRLWDVAAITVDAWKELATIRLSATLLSNEAQDVHIRTTIFDPDGTVRPADLSVHHLSVGETAVDWELLVDEPDLWWPHSLGDQPLYEIDVEVLVDGKVSDRHTLTTGIRSVKMKNWILSINGERLFVKGAVHWPTQRDIAQPPAARVAADVQAAKDLGLDLLRVHTHVARPELYAAADRAGIMLWQDFPLSGRAAKSIRDKARRSADAMARLLGHHPSIVMWCAHDDPTSTSRRPDKKPSTVKAIRTVLGQEAPSWNKTVLDRSISHAIEHVDPSRPVIAHSGAWPSPPMLDGTDSHLWFGWSTGTGRDISAFARTMPRMVRWVSAFGAQSVPTDAPFCEPERWPDLNWSNLQGEFGLDRRAMAEFVPTAGYVTFDDWVAATQDYQATVLRRQIEYLRRLKFKPTGGFCFTALADCREAVSFSILDYERRPKIAWAAVKAACAPVIVVADRLPSVLHPGDSVALDVHVVSDATEDLGPMTINAHLTWLGGAHDWTWTGSVPAGQVVRSGMVSWIAPESLGPVCLALTLTQGDDPDAGATTDAPLAQNYYHSAITPQPLPIIAAPLKPPR